MDEHSERLVLSESGSHLHSQGSAPTSTLPSPAQPIQWSRHPHQRDASYSLLNPISHHQEPERVLEDRPTSNPEPRDSSSLSGRSKERPSDSGYAIGGSRRPHYLLNWWQELAACTLVIAALLGLFATLYHYVDRPSPDWPTWLSLNTIVAIYVVLLKTGILLITAEGIGQLKWAWLAKRRPLADIVKYDNATRGPLGALVLLWRLRYGHLLSSLGALVTVLSLAVDPFAQQILRYYECSPIMPNAMASLPRTNYFEANGSHTGTLFETIEPAMQSAINAGIFSAGASLPPECSTGNCTWASDYSTVGWCSSCTDISSQLIFENITSRTFDSYTDAFTYQWSLRTSLPNGGLSVNMSGPSLVDGFGGVLEETFAAMGASTSDTENTAFASVIDFVLAKDVLGTIDPSTGMTFPDCNNTATNQTWKCVGYGASRCRLYPCTRTYAAFVKAGTLNETQSLSTENWNISSNNNESGLTMTTLDTHCINAAERQSLTALGYQVSDGERWLAYNYSSAFSKWSTINNTFPGSMLLRDCVYGMDLITASSLSQYFDTLLSGSITGSPPLGENEAGLFSGPQAVQAIFNFGNVTFESMESWFEQIALSLTKYMRQNGVANFSSPAMGITTQEKTCIAVRWPWLVFPATLVLMTLTFFGLMVLETRPTGKRQDIWKSSPLALLYHGLVDREGSTQGVPPNSDVNHMQGMEAMARETHVKLSSYHDYVTRLEIQDSD